MAQKGDEFLFIDRIKNLFADIDNKECKGIGDDCATIPISPDSSLVVTSDMLNEGVHFIRSAIPAFDLGYKSLAVNLSDIAAMGAEPIASFLSIGFSKEIPALWRDEFMAGYHSLSKEFGVALLGGDTTSTTGGISINVTAIGRAKSSHIKLRSAANIGQDIYVSGTLGDSGVGLQMILNGRWHQREMIDAHHRPRPYVNEGVWLGEREEVGAMIDISDGVASDLRHILRLSGVGAIIDNIPTSQIMDRACKEYNLNREHLALSAGEDYRLLFTVDREQSEQLADSYKKQFGYAPYKIGHITAGNELLLVDTPLDYFGYIHD